MTSTPQAYPLSWPDGWKRTPPASRRNGKFQRYKRALTIADARTRLTDELDRIRAVEVTLSTNVELRADGAPRSDRREPDDPGVAVYFRMPGNRPVALACDHYLTVADNIAALAAVVEAKRAILRHGVVTAEQEFRGYLRLPPPITAGPPWREVLGMAELQGDLPKAAVLDIAEGVFRRLSRSAHPDQPGGSGDAQARLNRAIEDARKELGNG